MSSNCIKTVSRPVKASFASHWDLKWECGSGWRRRRKAEEQDSRCIPRIVSLLSCILTNPSVYLLACYLFTRNALVGESDGPAFVLYYECRIPILAAFWIRMPARSCCCEGAKCRALYVVCQMPFRFRCPTQQHIDHKTERHTPLTACNRYYTVATRMEPTEPEPAGRKEPVSPFKPGLFDNNLHILVRPN